jgi:hypothetical protein
MRTVAIFAFCRKCGAKRMFDRRSKAGYSCRICKGPKPQSSPIIRREVQR